MHGPLSLRFYVIIYVGGWVRLGVGGTVCQLVACWEQEREIQKMEGGEKAKCRREISSARALCVASGSLRY